MNTKLFKLFMKLCKVSYALKLQRKVYGNLTEEQYEALHATVHNLSPEHRAQLIEDYDKELQLTHN